MSDDVLNVSFWRRGYNLNKIDCVITLNSKYKLNPRRAILTFESYEEGCLVDPTFSLDIKTAQEIADNLWSLGIRPSEGSGSAGSLKATQYHLEDMRKLVFEKGK